MSREDYEDIIAGVRAGRLTAESARRLLDQRHRDISAHSHAQALQDAHQALDRGHKANYSDDEFAHLFPPGAKPLDPDDDEDQDITLPNKPKVFDKEKRASAFEPYSDEELFRALYPPGSRFED